nr:hypothetical protein Iba_chr04fCG0340 [Ipomoea batatas]
MKDWSLVKLEKIDSGNFPPKEFSDIWRLELRSKYVRIERLAIASGIGPVKLLWERSKWVSSGNEMKSKCLSVPSVESAGHVQRIYLKHIRCCSTLLWCHELHPKFLWLMMRGEKFFSNSRKAWELINSKTSPYGFHDFIGDEVGHSVPQVLRLHQVRYSSYLQARNIHKTDCDH